MNMQHAREPDLFSSTCNAIYMVSLARTSRCVFLLYTSRFDFGFVHVRASILEKLLHAQGQYKSTGTFEYLDLDKVMHIKVKQGYVTKQKVPGNV